MDPFSFSVTGHSRYAGAASGEGPCGGGSLPRRREEVSNEVQRRVLLPWECVSGRRDSAAGSLIGIIQLILLLERIVGLSGLARLRDLSERHLAGNGLRIGVRLTGSDRLSGILWLSRILR